MEVGIKECTKMFSCSKLSSVLFSDFLFNAFTTDNRKLSNIYLIFSVELFYKRETQIKFKETLKMK